MIGQHITIKNIDTVKGRYRGKTATVLSEHVMDHHYPVSAVVQIDNSETVVSVFASQIEENLREGNEDEMEL